ncbi:MAG: hypothetical protein IJ083_00300 [Clostridia bacterium]|nr:hypothetical protein [Clostridia bacterium]
MQEDIPETMRFSDMEGPSPEQVRAENREIRKELNAKITRHRLLIGAIWIVCLIYYGELGASSAPIFLAIGLSVFLTRKNRRVREELEALVDPIGVDEVLWPDRPLEPETEHLEDVVRWLEELGFTRIVRLPVRDILTPLSSKSGQVISVTIGGRAPKRGRVFKREDQVTISYHESKLKRFLRS